MVSLIFLTHFFQHSHEFITGQILIWVKFTIKWKKWMIGCVFYVFCSPSFSIYIGKLVRIAFGNRSKKKPQEYFECFNPTDSSSWIKFWIFQSNQLIGKCSIDIFQLPTFCWDISKITPLIIWKCGSFAEKEHLEKFCSWDGIFRTKGSILISFNHFSITQGSYKSRKDISLWNISKTWF